MRRIPYSSEDKARKSGNKKKQGDRRNDFEIDRSRVIHSAAFRRLQGKTQVFEVGKGDFYRTRLTHTLEVAQIGKGLAIIYGAHPDLVEAICLAHDIGHPAFGHIGERLLNRLMRNAGGFSANAQNLRILCHLEARRVKPRGLDLTRATLDGVTKYKEAYDGSQQDFYYADDEGLVRWIDNEGYGSRSFECQIMDWADDIAYAVHDLEDALRSRFVSYNDFVDDSLRDLLIRDVSERLRANELNVSPSQVLDGWNELLKYAGTFLRYERADPFFERKALRKQLTSELIDGFLAGCERRERHGDRRPRSARYQYKLEVSGAARVKQTLLTQLVRLKVMRSPQVRTLEYRATHILKGLFVAFTKESERRDLLPEDWREELDSCRDEVERKRVACDYIAGMTDSYAEQMYARLYLPGTGSIYEVL